MAAQRVIWFLLALVGVCRAQVNVIPDGFMCGTGSAAYQVEGGWDEDGKGPSIWDDFFHEHPDWANNGENGDVTSDSYHKYADDIQAVVDLGADMYRFSISWSRVLPTGDLNIVNQAGIDYYNNIIDLLVENGITPLVTMYHWDLPLALQYIGGWTNPLMSDYFVEYARFLFDNFGDRVKWWTTFNEPSIISAGYSTYAFTAPSQNATGIGYYLATHTVLRSHGQVYRLYEDQYRATQNGQVGIGLSADWYQPIDDTTESLEASERMFQFQLGLHGHPIFSEEGDYPEVVRTRVDANSAAEGRPRSRLPTFTEEEIEYIRGSADFLGLNSYSTSMVQAGEDGANPSWERDSGVIRSTNDSWPTSPVAGWLQVVPWGYRRLLNNVNAHYPNVPIILTENGYADEGALDDPDRISYIGQYLAAALQAVNIDGVNVIAYNVWSLIDSLEWTSGFSQRFGLYQIDFNSTDLTRTPRASAAFIAEVYRNRTVPMEYFDED